MTEGFGITIHTERLHDDRVWKRVILFTAFLEKRGISAEWFAINPSYDVYRRMDFDERKWKERLAYLTNHGQRIEQHTHFYKGEKGTYDLSAENVTERLREDRAWLTCQGYNPTRFVSGGWRMSAVIRGILHAMGYEDSTEDARTLSPRKAFAAIMRRVGSSPPLLYFHDYELVNPLILFFIKRIILYWYYRSFPIVLHPHDHKCARDWTTILGFINSFFFGKNIRSVLELGAGTGNISFYFARRDVRAIVEDINQEYINKIKDRDSRIETVAHDINMPLSFGSACFDVVFCIGILHYSCVQSPEFVLREALRVSNRYVVVDFFSNNSLYSFLERLRYPRFAPRRYSGRALRALFAGIGVTPVASVGIRPLFGLSHFPLSGKSAIYILEKRTQ